jgi:hypothetical protein
MLQTKVAEKIKTSILCAIMFFQKSCHLGYNVKKYRKARQVTDDII